VEFNYIGVLVLFGCIPVALVVGALWRLREYLQWRDLGRKYRGERGTANLRLDPTGQAPAGSAAR